MAQGTISVSIGCKVAPWVYRYLDMVKARAMRTQQKPLLDIVVAVAMRGISLTWDGQPWPCKR
jgi:hypothetical protein